MTDVSGHDWRVYLAVRSSVITPDEMTERLGMVPDRSSNDSRRRWPYIWEAGSDLPGHAELDEHLRALAERFSDKAGGIAVLADVGDTVVVIEAVLRFAARGDSGSFPSVWIPPEVIAFAARANVGIDIDIYTGEPS